MHDTGVVGVGRGRQVPQIVGRRNSGRGCGVVVAATSAAVAVGRDRVVGRVVVERRVRRPDRCRAGRDEPSAVGGASVGLPVVGPVDRQRLAARLDDQSVTQDGGAGTALGFFALRRERNCAIGKPVKGQVLVRQEGH